jgi:aminoglycoside 2''-phosphotransferase
MTNKYIKNIQRIYPDLWIHDFYLNENGQNNDVFVVNDSIIFRFPKYDEGIAQLNRETGILNYLKGIISLPIPDARYSYFEESEPGKVFTGYKLIEGNPLWRESLFDINDDGDVRGLASQLVSFLKEIHSISTEQASRDLGLQIHHPLDEMDELYKKIQLNLFPFMKKESQNEVTISFMDFLKVEEFSTIKASLIHGDFGASNILWNPEKRKVSGIIDFGGSRIGDPAYDFAGILSSYGEEFYNMCMELYPNGKEISKRVHFYRSTFALQEALHGVENNDRHAFENRIKEYR